MALLYCAATTQRRHAAPAWLWSACPAPQQGPGLLQVRQDAALLEVTPLVWHGRAHTEDCKLQ